MTDPRPPATLAILILAAGLGQVAAPARAQALAVPDGRQVTVFGVLATPGQAKDDPKLKAVLPQLRNLVPNHSFKLLKVESKRAIAGGIVRCDLGDGFVASTALENALDINGKVQLRFDLSVGGFSQYQTIVTTPPNQTFFINRMLPNGDRLVIGIGAR